MYTSQVNAAATQATGAKKPTAKATKADQSFADVLSQKADSPADTAANQPQKTQNDTTSGKTTADQKQPAQKDTAETTNGETNAPAEETGEIVCEKMEVELTPPVMFLLNVPSPTPTVEVAQEETAVTSVLAKGQEGAQTNQEALMQNVIKPEETKQQQTQATVQPTVTEQTKTNDLPKTEMPAIVTQEQAAPAEQQAAPTVKAEAAVTDTTDEKPMTEQTPQTVAAAQTTENFRQESIEVKIPVSDSSSILQRQTTQQLTDKIISQFKDGVQQFTLSLHPERLGHVVVNMAFEHGMLHLRVETHSQLAQNLLVGGLADLKNTLNENGIQVSDVDISPFAEQRQNEQQQEHAGHSRFGGGQNAQHGSFDEETDEEAENGVALGDGLLDYSI